MQGETDVRRPWCVWCTGVWCDRLCIKATRTFSLLRFLGAVAEIQFKEDKIALWLTFSWTALSENDRFGTTVNREPSRLESARCTVSLKVQVAAVDTNHQAERIVIGARVGPQTFRTETFHRKVTLFFFTFWNLWLISPCSRAYYNKVLK